VSEGGVGMMNLNVALRYHRPLSHWGRVREGGRVWQVSPAENISELPGVARRLVTFFCFAKKKVTKDNEVAVKANMRSMLCRSQKATPIRHLFEVPCVARQLRRLRNSHDPLRVHVLKQSSPTTPELSPLLGGGQGEGVARRVQWVASSFFHFSKMCVGMK